MSENESKGKGKEALDRASLNSGLRYYDLIIKSMENTMRANICGDYDTWTCMLYQIWNWMSPFVAKTDADEVYKELEKITVMLTARKDSPSRLAMTGVSLNKNIRYNILMVERKIYEKTKYMLLPTSKGASSDLDWSRLALG